MAECRFDIGIVTSDLRLIDRVRAIAGEFGYTLKEFSDLSEFLSAKCDLRLIIAFVRNEKNPRLAAEMAQTARMVCADAFVICCVERGLPKETASFARKSGADLIVLEDELFETSKLEFMLTQVLRASFLPIKSGDIVPDKALTFDIYHLLPQRKKFIKFLFQGDIPDEARIRKVSEVGEVYISRKAADSFNQYVRETQDDSPEGTVKRLRAQYLALYSGFASLVFLLTDQSELASLGDGSNLLARCRGLIQELLATFGKFGNAWELISLSTIGDAGSVERAPAIASYTALFALSAGIDKIDDLMLAALLSGLGLVFLPPAITRKLREDRSHEMNADEFSVYSQYLDQSLAVLLDRKLSIDEKTRHIILSIHERVDGNGFPRRHYGYQVPEASQLIQFSQEFDHRTVLRLGKPRPDPLKVLGTIFDEGGIKYGRFSDKLLMKLRQAFAA